GMQHPDPLAPLAGVLPPGPPDLNRQRSAFGGPLPPGECSTPIRSLHSRGCCPPDPLTSIVSDPPSADRFRRGNAAPRSARSARGGAAPRTPLIRIVSDPPSADRFRRGNAAPRSARSARGGAAPRTPLIRIVSDPPSADRFRRGNAAP